MTKKKTIKNRIVKKRKIIKRRRRTVKNGSFLRAMKKNFLNIKKIIRQEQRRCLRYKKYKKKQSFCFVKAVLLKYPRRVIVSFLIFSFIGSAILYSGLQNKNFGKYFGSSLQTNLINDLTDKIRQLTGQIDDRKKCTEDKYWEEPIGDVCNYYLYQQENKHCAKFGVPTTRVAIGTKQCCKEKGLYREDNKNKLVACPGADIFFKKSKMFNATVVPTKDQCDLGVCEFYPGNGFHAKLNEDGSIFYDENHNIVLEKDCPTSQEVTSCSKPCGGGKRIRTVHTRECLEIKTSEICNPQSCYMESN